MNKKRFTSKATFGDFFFQFPPPPALLSFLSLSHLYFQFSQGLQRHCLAKLSLLRLQEVTDF